MLRLVCIDVDGTLIGESGEPTSGILDAIMHARSLGQTLALATARGAMGPTADYASLLNPHGWHIFHAGASLVHTGSSAIIGEALPNDIIRIGTELSGIHGWALEYYSPNDYRTLDDSLADRSLAAAHSEMLGCDFKVGDPSDLAEPIVRLQFVVNESQVSEILELMAGKGNVSVATSPVLEGAAFISITKAGVNKGSAILRMCELLSLDAAEVMMVGDGLNDLDALEVVGHSVAMGNAHQDLINSCDYVVAPVEEDGLVEALELSWTL